MQHMETGDVIMTIWVAYESRVCVQRMAEMHPLPPVWLLSVAVWLEPIDPGDVVMWGGVQHEWPANSIVPLRGAELGEGGRRSWHDVEKNCRTGPIKIVRHEKRRQEGRGAHVCTKMYIHRIYIVIFTTLH